MAVYKDVVQGINGETSPLTTQPDYYYAFDKTGSNSNLGAQDTSQTESTNANTTFDSATKITRDTDDTDNSDGSWKFAGTNNFNFDTPWANTTFTSTSGIRDFSMAFWVKLSSTITGNPRAISFNYMLYGTTSLQFGMMPGGGTVLNSDDDLLDTSGYCTGTTQVDGGRLFYAGTVTYGNPASVSSILLSGTSPVQITTTAAHGYTTGDTVAFSGVGGTVELNGNVYTITVTSTTVYTLDGTDSSAFTAFTSGGFGRNQGRIRLYENGVLIDSRDHNVTTHIDVTSVFRLGGQATNAEFNNNTYPFKLYDGNMNHVMVWYQHELTQAEITGLWDAGRGQDTVDVEVTVVDESGTAIENARVYIVEDGTSTEVLNALTNASGVASTTYSSYTFPQAVEGWVRKSTTGTLYRQFSIGGSITTSGFATTAIMVED